MKIGFMGLGNMGAGMADNLLRAGHEVTVYNRTRARAEPLVASGATIAADIREACRGDAVFTMLANDEAARRVVFGEGGILDALPKGAVHISSSTISVALAAELEAAHANAEQGYVSAPVFGRPDVVAAGNLFVVAAGATRTVETINSLLDAIAQRTFVVSESPKAANLIKLSGNFLIASVFESLGEALALVGKAGMDRHQYLDILTSTLFGASVFRTYGALVADQKFEPAGFAAPLGQKDIRLVLAAAVREPPAGPFPGAYGAGRRHARLVDGPRSARFRRWNRAADAFDQTDMKLPSKPATSPYCRWARAIAACRQVPISSWSAPIRQARAPTSAARRRRPKCWNAWRPCNFLIPIPLLELVARRRRFGTPPEGAGSAPVSGILDMEQIAIGKSLRRLKTDVIDLPGALARSGNAYRRDRTDARRLAAGRQNQSDRGQQFLHGAHGYVLCRNEAQRGPAALQSIRARDSTKDRPSRSGAHCAPDQLDPIGEVEGRHIDARTSKEIDAILKRIITDRVSPAFMAPPESDQRPRMTAARAIGELIAGATLLFGCRAQTGRHTRTMEDEDCIMSHVDIPNITLNDNTTLPGIGFGTYKLNGSEGVAGMMSAIRNGYRLLDSAFNYENEGAVGEAVRQAGIPRAELRVTSKLPGRHHRYSEAIATIEESLYRAQLDYYAPFGCQLSVDLDRSNFHEPWVSFIPCLGTPSPGVFQDIR